MWEGGSKVVLTGDEMFTVGTRVSTHARELRPDLIDQELLLFSIGNRECPLQNVVYEGIRKSEKIAVSRVVKAY